MNTLPDAREVILGVLTRLRILAPVAMVLWLLGVSLTPGVRLLLVPVVVLALVLDTVAGAPASGTTVRVRPGGAR